MSQENQFMLSMDMPVESLRLKVNLLQGRFFFSDCSPVGTGTVLLTKKQQKLAGFRILTGTATTHDISTYVA